MNNCTYRLTATEIDQDGQHIWSGQRQTLGESYGVTYATREEADAALRIAQWAADEGRAEGLSAGARLVEYCGSEGA